MSSRLQLTAVSALHQLSLHHHRDDHDDHDHDGDDCDDDDDDSDISCIMIMIAIMMVTMMDTMVMIMTMRMVVPWYHQLPMPNLDQVKLRLALSMRGTACIWAVMMVMMMVMVMMPCVRDPMLCDMASRFGTTSPQPPKGES